MTSAPVPCRHDRERSQGSPELSLPARRSRLVLSWWQRQQRGLRLPVEAGPWATWG